MYEGLICVEHENITQIKASVHALEQVLLCRMYDICSKVIYIIKFIKHHLTLKYDIYLEPSLHWMLRFCSFSSVLVPTLSLSYKAVDEVLNLSRLYPLLQILLIIKTVYSQQNKNPD